MRAFYTIGIWFYTLGIRLAALFGHSKARLMVKGWAKGNNIRKSEGGTAWFHAASLGEFEQARPVLEEYKHRHPDCRIVVTFFSPSGYEVRKNYPTADVVLYLPPDLPSLPTYIFSAIFRPSQYFFKPWGYWFRKELKDCFNHLFVQNKESLELLRSIGIGHCSVAGDTRFDRVHQIALAAENNDTVERFLDGHHGKVLVCGSTWPPDEELIHQLSVTGDELRMILAPHVISEEHLKQIEGLFPDSVRYSKLTSGTLTTNQVLIIDNIGLLSKLYRYADVAYIGGGFGVGIHNILEAVTFGKPVLFGPNHQKFQEAKDIIACGGGFCHSDQISLERHLKSLLTDAEAYRRASQACLDYMNANLGSTEKILSTIEH